MCKYKCVEKDAREEEQIFDCLLEKYFSLLEEVKGYKLELPTDEEGFCIFHSENIEWKRINKFDYWIRLLFEFISLVDSGTIEYEHNGWKEFDLRGIKWIGCANENGKSSIVFSQMNYNSAMYFLFGKGIFYDQFLIENCNSPECDIDLSLCAFLEPVSVTHINLSRISFDSSSFQNGFDMGKCKFFKDASFYSMKVSGEFCVAFVEFEDEVNFSFSKFDTTLWMLNSVSMNMDTDFSSCIFNGRMEIENCCFLARTSFRNAVFNDFVEFLESEYHEDIFFDSEMTENKMFNKSVCFNLGEDNVLGCFHFKNINFFNIAEKDREFLLSHQKDSKANIGDGCIKYKVQSPLVEIKTDSINQCIIEELTYSFKNYIFRSSGFNLGVEFQNKSIDKIALFYFTDENIEQSEFLHRLGFWGNKYWAFPSDTSDLHIGKSEIAVQKLDDFISKLALLRKIAVRDMCGYWYGGDTELLFDIIPCIENREKLLETFVKTIASFKINIRMQIDNLNVHGGQVNILENVNTANIQQTVNTLPDELTKSLELLLKKLSEKEVIELQEAVSSLNVDSTTSEKESLKEKVYNFMSLHGIAIAQSMTASAIFEGLRALFGIG